jgi:hypothetical protein
MFGTVPAIPLKGPKKEEEPPRSSYRRGFYSTEGVNLRHRVEWVLMPVDKTKIGLLDLPPRNTGPSPLTTLSEKPDIKLPKITDWEAKVLGGSAK